MRTQIVAGNWKMNTSLEEGKKLASEVVNMVADEVRNDASIVLCPPFLHLSSVLSLVGTNDKISIGAQNCHQNDDGAYTGEIAAPMLSGAGVTYVIIGHSERREYFNEFDSLLAEKVNQVLANGMIPIFCCGEKLESREEETQEAVVQDQVQNALFHLSDEEVRKIVIAYEPVWAIGTGRTASAEQAQEMHAFIRSILREKYSEATADTIPILYGGSVKPNNAKEIFSQPDVDGGLIGGASLKSRDFTDIIKAI